MAARITRFLPSLVLDGLIVLAVAFPDSSAYLKWPMLGVYGVMSWRLMRRLSEHRWIMTIVRDPATRIAHGLEHATIAVLLEEGLPVTRGFTHGHNRFVVVLEHGHDTQVAVVQNAAARSIDRILRGERSLAYQPGCGTSEAVSAASLWLVYAVSMVFAIAVGRSAAIWLAISVIVLRLWFAGETALGLLAQRLYTVSTDFVAAKVIDVRETRRIRGYQAPTNETWFEVVVDFRIGASQGGLVAPGSLP